MPLPQDDKGVLRNRAPRILTAIHRTAWIVLGCACSTGLLSPAIAQLPSTQLDGIYPLGASPGTKLELLIAGDDLADVDRLLFSHPEITAKPKTVEPGKFEVGPQRVPNTFEVQVDPSVPPGRYEVRCQGRYGLSNARRFQVRRGSAAVEVEPNHDPKSATAVAAPSMIDGRLSENADVDSFRVSAAADSLLVIDVLAQQLDSPLQAVIRASDDAGRILAEAGSTAGQDPSLLVTVPASGRLLLTIHDSQFRKGDTYSYRLQLSTRPQIDFLFPPAVEAGQSNRRIVYGRNLPGGRPTKLIIDGQPLLQKEVTLQVPPAAADQLNFSGRLEPHVAVCDGFEFRLEDNGLASNPLLIAVAAAPIVREGTDNDTPETAQSISLPVEVAGQFYPERDVDWYRFEAEQGDQIAIELYSHRLGLPTDPALLLQQVIVKEDGSQEIRDVTFVDDPVPPRTRNESGRHEFETSSSDPSYRFEVPADGTYRLLVKDGYSSLHSDARSAYRLVVRPPEPDFRIIAVPAESAAGFQLRREGRQLIRVFAERRDGFDGPIRVRVNGLPQGVTSEEIAIGPGNRMGTLVLTAGAGLQAGISDLAVVATANIDGQPVQHAARYGAASLPYRMGQPNSRLANIPARLTDGIQLMVLDEEPAPATITLGSGAPLKTCRGMTLKIPYQAKKRDGVGGNLLAFPMDFPQNASVGQINIGNNTKGEFDLRLNSTAPPGEHTIYLAGYLQNMPYRHHPEAVEQAKQRQQHVAELLEQAGKDLQTAQQMARDASNKLNQANSTLTTARQARTVADQQRIAANNKYDAANNLLQALQKQVQSNPEDEALAAKVKAAQQAATRTAEERTQAVKKLEAAADELQQAESAAKQATEAKTKADRTVNEARMYQQEAQREKQRVDQIVRTTEQTARQRNINVNIPSNSLKIHVAEYPVQWQTVSPQTVRQGQTHEVRLKLKRLFDYQGNLSIQIRQPPGLAGLNVSNLNIPGSSSEGVLKLNVAATATPGTHTLTLRITFSGLSGTLVMEQPVNVTIVEVKKEA